MMGTNPHLANITKKEWPAIISCLMQLRTERTEENYGICANLSNLLFQMYKQQEIIFLDGYGIVSALAEGWSHHSGCSTYPIPGTRNIIQATWDPAEPLGQMRYELLEHLIIKANALASS